MVFTDPPFSWVGNGKNFLKFCQNHISYFWLHNTSFHFIKKQLTGGIMSYSMNDSIWSVKSNHFDLYSKEANYALTLMIFSNFLQTYNYWFLRGAPCIIKTSIHIGFYGFYHSWRMGVHSPCVKRAMSSVWMIRMIAWSFISRTCARVIGVL